MRFLNELFKTGWWLEKFKKWFGGGQNMDNTNTNSINNTNESPGIIKNGDNKQTFIKFDPTLVLPDSLFNYGDSEDFDITNFLKIKESFLSDFTVNSKTVEDIIKEPCKYYNVNPRWILCRLQCEQSLIGKKKIDEVKSYTKTVVDKDGNKIQVTIYPIEWCLGFGLLDGKPPIEKYRGFDVQISNAARRCRELFDQGASEKGKDFETIDFTAITNKVRTIYVKETEEMLIKIRDKNIQYAAKYNLGLSKAEEKNLLITTKTQFAYLILMYTPHLENCIDTYNKWMSYFPSDLIFA